VDTKKSRRVRSSEVTNNNKKKEKEARKMIMAYKPPHPNQAAIDFARYGVAFTIGAQVIIWRGR
jgi:hypothetical protein